MTKKYLGKTADLTLAQLEHIAGMVHAQSQTHIPPPVSPATARTDGEMDSTQHPILARHDPLHPLFLTAFSGSHRYVLDYLSDEVLARQPAPVQQFLLHTSILERLSGPLCDEVMEQEESQAMLEALERANLFVVALDDERRWYRYHQLFVEVLRSHLQQARGNSHEALATLDALAHLTEQRHFSARVMTQVDAERAQLKLAQGDLAAGLRWAVSSGLSTSDEELPYSREGAYLALARVRIVQVRDGLNGSVLQKVLSLLDRLLKDAESKTRQSSVLEILILCALALEVRGDRTGALSTLERALVLAAIGMK